MTEDTELLRRYAEEGVDDAFAELVRRHVNLVYSAALRQLNGDAHLAADATQIVFTDLARKARKLGGHRVLAGWLFTSTRFTTAKLVRSERRRQAREQEAQLMQDLNQDDAATLDWQQVRPVLDDALAELAEGEREAILLRYFEGRDYASVGARLHLADNAARMRVERAVEKLRTLLARRGVTSTTAALAVALANQAVAAAPAGLAAAVTGVALAGGGAIAAATGGGAAAATFMSISKLQLGLSGALAIAGATGFVIQANTNSELRAEVARLSQETSSATTLQRDNDRLARTAAEVTEMRSDDAEFARLQEEATALRGQLQQLARAEEARAGRARNAAQTFDIRQLDTQPVAKFMARPAYPAAMRATGTSGEVVVDFVVDAEGDVQKATAVRSSQREFEEAAVTAVSKWKFKPGQKGGQAVGTHLQVPIVFSLANDKTAQRHAEGAAETKSNAVKLEPFTVQAPLP